jgi:hypothetical protein
LLTVTVLAAKGAVAGPATTEPSVILNLAPWQGQLIVPSATWLQMHPTWVQTALKALYSPLTGWVTTTLAAVNAIPPPTGISEALPSTVPIGMLLLALFVLLAVLALPFMEPPFMALAELDGWLAMPLDMALDMPSPEAAAVLGSVPVAGSALLASYGTALVLHAVSTPATPITPAPSSTQRLVAH